MARLAVIKPLEILQDELRPISCSGQNSQGGMAMTLIDALDSLIVGYSARHNAFAV